eukprot:jgi/Botrbrau1/278/Bobra.0022s0247.1
MPLWATWVVPLLAVQLAAADVGDPGQSIPSRQGHARSLLHGAHAADAPEEFLDHIAADGKNPSTYLLSILQGNSSSAGSLDLGQLSSLMWYIKGHLKVLGKAGRGNVEAHQESSASLIAHYGRAGRIDASGLQLATTAIIACISDEGCTLGSDTERPAFLLTGEGLAALPQAPQQATSSFTWLKWVGAALLFLEALLGVLIPILARCLPVQTRRAQQGLSFLNAFAGGVFLAFGLMHLAPEAFETQKAVYKGSYPLAGLFIASGFFLFFTLQRVLAPLLATSDAPATAPSGSCCVALVPLPESQKGLKDNCCEEAGACPCEEPVEGTKPVGGILWSYVSPALLMLALCVHAAFEGLTLGLQTSRAGVITVLVAMVSHKWVESIALTTRFLRAGPRPWWAMILMLFPFAVVVPVGVAVGIVLTSINAWVTLVLFGLISGMFIYVGGYEIIAEEFAAPVQGQKVFRFCLFVAMMIGFTLVALLQLVHDG